MQELRKILNIANTSVITGKTANNEIVLETPKFVEPPTRADEVQEDYEFARKNIREVIEEGTRLFANVSFLARTANEPRAFEVMTQHFKNLITANKELLEMHEQMNKVTDAPKPEAKSINVDKAVFVGSTKELIEQTRNAANTTDENDK